MVEDMMPSSGEGWTELADAWERAGRGVRSMEALKARFTALVNSKKPTGAPDIPPNVLRAKRIWRDIGNENANGCGDGDKPEQEPHCPTRLPAAGQ